MYAITPLSIDVISTMDDRELDSRFRDVSRAIQKIKNPAQKIKLEEEFCYIFREREIRAKRSEAHYEYLNSLRNTRTNNYNRGA